MFSTLMKFGVSYTAADANGSVVESDVDVDVDVEVEVEVEVEFEVEVEVEVVDVDEDVGVSDTLLRAALSGPSPSSS